MDEHGRLWSLLDKFGAPLVDTRRRAVASVLTKVERGLLDVSEPEISRKLLDGINVLLQSISSKESQHQDLETVLKLLKACCPFPQDKSESIAKVNEHLSRLKESALLPPLLHQFVGEVQAHLCFVPAPAEERPAAKPISAIPSNLVATSAIQGAGAILFSRLSFYGRHLAPVLVAELDDHFLFDAEVKLKLRHEACEDLLVQLLDDFPTAVLMQRSSVLKTLLDVVGEPFSQSDVDRSPLGVHAVGAINALTRLLRRGILEAQQELDGGLCAARPPVKAGVDSTSNEELRLERLTLLIHQLRFPCEQAGDSALALHASAAGAPPVPSLSGLAFAALAAALPLLQSRDPEVFRAVQQLGAVAMDALLEPAHAAATQCLDVNRQRVLHLVMRFDQLLTILDPAVQDAQEEKENAAMDAAFVALWADFLVRVVGQLLASSHGMIVQLPFKSWEKLQVLLVCQTTALALVGRQGVQHLEAVAVRQDPHALEQLDRIHKQASAIRGLQRAGGLSLEELIECLERTLPLCLDAAQANMSVRKEDVVRGLVRALVLYPHAPGGAHELDRRLICLRDRALMGPAVVRLCFFDILAVDGSAVQPYPGMGGGLVIQALCQTLIEERDHLDLCAGWMMLLGALCRSMLAVASATRPHDLVGCVRYLRAALYIVPSAARFELVHVEAVLRTVEDSKLTDDADDAVASLCVGLFHFRADVRAEAALLLRRLVSADDSGLSLDSADPLRGLTMLSLRSCCSPAAAVEAPSRRKEPAFGHADVRRLLQILETTDMETRVRAAAADQLVQMLRHEHALLVTCPVAVIKNLAQATSRELAAQLCGDDGRVLCRERVERVDASTWAMLRALVHLLVLFVDLPELPLVEWMVYRNAGEGLYVMGLLVQCIVRGPELWGSAASREAAAFLSLCWQAVHLVAFHPSRWLIGGPQFLLENLGWVCLADDKTGNCTLSKANWAGKDRVRREDASDWDFTLELATCEHSSRGLVPRVWAWVLDQLTPETGETDRVETLRMCEAFAQSVHWRDVPLSDHDELGRAVFRTVCEVLPIHSFEDFQALVAGDAARAGLLRKGLSTLGALCQFCAVQGFLNAVLDRLRDLLQDSRHRAKPMLADRDLARFCLSVLRGVGPHSLDLGSLPDVLSRLWQRHFLAPESACHVDAEVMDLFAELLGLPEGVQFFVTHLCTGAAGEMENGQFEWLRSPWVLMIRAARTPDSFRGGATYVHALRALLHCLRSPHNIALRWPGLCADPDSTDHELALWHWVARGLYDRRSAIKCLSLELLMLLPEPVLEQVNGAEEAVVALGAEPLEAPSVRARALALLVRVPDWLSRRGVEAVATSAHELLGQGISTEGLLALRVLSALLRKEPEEAGSWLRTLRVFPRLVQLLSGDVSRRTRRMREARLLCVDPTASSTAAVLVPLYCEQVLLERAQTAHTFVHTAERLVLQTFYDSPTLFEEVLQRSAFVEQLLGALATTASAWEGAGGLVAQARQLITRFDLLVVVMQAPGGEAIVARHHSTSLLSAFRALLLLAGHAQALSTDVLMLTAASVCRYVHLFVETAFLRDPGPDADSGAESEDAQIQAEAEGEALARVFKATLRLRGRLLDMPVAPSALGAGLDSLIAVLMQRLPACLDIFYLHANRPDSLEQCLLRHHLRCLINAARTLERDAADGDDSSVTSIDSLLTRRHGDTKPRATAPSTKAPSTKAPSTKGPSTKGPGSSTVRQASWRERTRGYVWQQQSAPPHGNGRSQASDAPSAARQLSAQERAELHCSLLVLSACLPACLPACPADEARDAVRALHELHARSLEWSLTAHLLSASETASGTACGGLHAVGSVSEGRLAAAVQSCVATLLGRSALARAAFLQAGPPSAARLAPPTTASAVAARPPGQALHRFLALGVRADNQPPALRNVSLHCAAALLPLVLPSGALRAEVTRICAQRLQQLAAPSAVPSDPAHAYFVTVAFAAALLQTGAGPSCYDRVRVGPVPADGPPLMPFAELVAGLAAVPEARCALFRAIGGFLAHNTAGDELGPLLAQRKVFQALLVCRDTEARALAALCVKILAQSSDKMRAQLRLASEAIGLRGDFMLAE